MEDRGSGGFRRREVVSGKTSYGSVQQVRTSFQHSRGDLKPWGGLNDPEMKRQRRIAKYKFIGVQVKLKASVRNGMRWIKNKCSALVDGF